MPAYCDKCEHWEGWVGYNRFKCKRLDNTLKKEYLRKGGCSQFVSKTYKLDYILGLKQ